MESKAYWVTQTEMWSADGTFDRLHTAMVNKEPVLIGRSDGSISVGHLVSVDGYGGRRVEVKIDDEKPLYKTAHTEVFLELNPTFGPSLLDLVPEEERKVLELKIARLK